MVIEGADGGERVLDPGCGQEVFLLMADLAKAHPEPL